VKNVASKDHLPTERLTDIISLPECTVKEGKSGIDQLYLEVLEQAFSGIPADEIEFYSHFRSVLGAVLLVFDPLSMDALSTLLGVSNIPSTLRSLHSLLLVPKSKADPVQIFHKSLPDFLMDSKRCKVERFFINPSVHHQEILLSCLSLMKRRLKKNICDLDNYTFLSEVEDLPACCKTHIGDELGYACQFWAKHLLGVPSNGRSVEEVKQAIDEFFITHLLFWMEVLSLIGNLDAGVYALNDIQQWYISVSHG